MVPFYGRRSPKKNAPRRYRKAYRDLNEAFQKGLRDMQERLGCGPIQTKLSVDAGVHLLSDATC